jgi:hypothetical protein
VYNSSSAEYPYAGQCLEFADGVDVALTIAYASNASSNEDCQSACGDYFNLTANADDKTLYYCNWIDELSSSLYYCYLFETCDFTWQSPTNSDTHEARVWHMWEIDVSACPTQAPTNLPTVNPTPPSNSPTHAPTQSPSGFITFFLLYKTNKNI